MNSRVGPVVKNLWNVSMQVLHTIFRYIRATTANHTGWYCCSSHSTKELPYNRLHFLPKVICFAYCSRGSVPISTSGIGGGAESGTVTAAVITDDNRSTFGRSLLTMMSNLR